MADRPRLTKENMEKILAKNEGLRFIVHSAGKSYDLTNTYYIEGGQMYQRQAGNTSMDGHVDHTYKLTYENTQQVIRNHSDKFNFDI